MQKRTIEAVAVQELTQLALQSFGFPTLLHYLIGCQGATFASAAFPASTGLNVCDTGVARVLR